MTQDQYNDKIFKHLDMESYAPLNKDPADSLTRKLGTVLKKLHKENNINKPFHNSGRKANRRRPQFYGLPKIHKPGNLKRPIVSFNNTPLSSLHKQVSLIFKLITVSLLRFKDSTEFVNHLSSYSDLDYF